MNQDHIRIHILVMSLAAVGCVAGREGATADQARPHREASRASVRGEAELNLTAIKKSAQTYFVETGIFPIGSQGLTPSQGCCAGGGRTCIGDPADWNGVPVWDDLDFQIAEDHSFRYSYESDGQTFEARAVGDPACDGNVMTFVMRGRIENGAPVADLITPADAE